MAYVTDQRWNSRAAQQAFDRFTEAHWPRAIRRQSSIRERILKAFRLEKGLRPRRIEQLEGRGRRLVEDLKRRLTPARYESLYGIWSQTSDQSVYDLVAPDPHELWPTGKLTVHLAPHNYRWLYPEQPTLIDAARPVP